MGQFYYIQDGRRAFPIEAQLRHGHPISPEDGLPLLLPTAEAETAFIRNAKTAGRENADLAKSMNTDLRYAADAEEQRRIKSAYKKRFFDLKKNASVATSEYANHPDTQNRLMEWDDNALTIEKLRNPRALWSDKDIKALCNRPDLSAHPELLADLVRIDEKAACANPEVQSYIKWLIPHHLQEGNLEAIKTLVTGENKNVANLSLCSCPDLLLKIAIEGDKKQVDCLNLILEKIPLTYNTRLQEAITNSSHHKNIVGCIINGKVDNKLLKHLIDPEDTGEVFNGHVAKLMRRGDIKTSGKLPAIPYMVVPMLNAHKEALSLDSPDIRPPTADPVHPAFSQKVYDQIYSIIRGSYQLEGAHQPEEGAYKLAVLFGNPTEAKTFLKKKVKALTGSGQPVHDALLFSIPTGVDWDAKTWGELLIKHGQPVQNILPLAPEIEKHIERQNRNMAKERRDFRYVLKRLSLEQLSGFASQINYTGQSSDPELAELCGSMFPKISQGGFDAGRKARLSISKEDHIPDIGIIDGKDIGYDKYYMLKIPKNDPRILLMGRFVDCCNHLDGATKEMAIHAVTSPDGGCYAIFEKSGESLDPAHDRIIAKTNVWRGQTKKTADEIPYSNLVFNSWERLPLPQTDESAGQTDYLWGEAFLKAAAEKALEVANHTNGMEAARRVTLGRNRDGFSSFPSTEPETPRDAGTASCDSDVQYEIASLDKNVSVSPGTLRNIGHLLHSSNMSIAGMTT